MKILDIKKASGTHVNEDSDPVDMALNTYVNHSSILKIKEYFNEHTEFNCLDLIPNDIAKEIKNVDNSKKCTFKNITPKSIKEALDICSPFLCDIRVDEIVYKGTFPKDFKNANPAPVFFKKTIPSFS